MLEANLYFVTFSPKILYIYSRLRQKKNVKFHLMTATFAFASRQDLQLAAAGEFHKLKFV